ncbi:uncharacterized protein HGUI_02447 [Hanseniaspora guilliermondii]|uniref:Uncharacterized protein n=1 Tax=Hanseniaspora guilliermondii TaxID=56406 RepID=A0A1L0CZF2_9ASCO|nr:uncharacterized protein HGUI_02447 [Hanseniaspora guilliermondii]
MPDKKDIYIWNIFSSLTNAFNNTNTIDESNVVTNMVESSTNDLSEFDIMNSTALRSIKNLSNTDKLLLLVYIKRKYALLLQARTLDINKEVLCAFYIIKEVFGESFQEYYGSNSNEKSPSSLSILRTIHHFINNKFEIKSFTPTYQIIILDEIKKRIENLNNYNSKTIKSHLSVFNSFATSKVILSDKEIKLFSKDVDGISESHNSSNYKEADNFIKTILDLDGAVDDVLIDEQQIDRTGYFNALTSGSILSTIQGTINSVYKTEENNNKVVMGINNKEFQDTDKPLIITQVSDETGTNVELLIDHQYNELVSTPHIKTHYKPLSKLDLFSEDLISDGKTLYIDYDNCIFLPSSNIKDYFHKRGILSKIGLGIRDHYRLDTGDLHLYLSNNYDNDLNTTVLKTTYTKTNLIISFQVCDLRYNTDINVSDQSLNSKIFADICDDNLRNLLKAQNTVNKKVTIDVPAINTETSNIDLIVEKVQDVFSKLDKEMNIFDGEMDNLLFITSGESFNLLILCLPYLRDYIQMKHHSSKVMKQFNYGNYPIQRLSNASRNNDTTITFNKVGILGLDVNPSYSSLYFPMGDVILCKDSIIYESLNWVLYNNITISLVADLYDCHQYPLQDKLLINILHPHLIRGLNVQINPIEDDSSLMYTEDYQKIRNVKIPINRRYEIVLIQYLLSLLNLGYILNDTIPLINMVSKIYESRAFNNLTRTSQLKRKLDKLKKEFVDKIEKLHIDWQNIDPEAMLNSFDVPDIDKDVEKIQYIYYCLIKKQLDNTISSNMGDILPQIKTCSIWSNNEVYKFFISNTLFTAFNYPQKNISVYNISSIEEAEISKEKSQYLLIWKLRDFVSNFVKMNNLPMYLNDIQNKLEKETVNNDYSSENFEYESGKADSIQCMKYLYQCYMDYAPPTNNRNLTEFKKEVLDMIWDVYESSDDFIDDLVN